MNVIMWLPQQPTEEDPDEGIRDLCEITMKLMVSVVHDGLPVASKRFGAQKYL